MINKNITYSVISYCGYFNIYQWTIFINYYIKSLIEYERLYNMNGFYNSQLENIFYYFYDQFFKIIINNRYDILSNNELNILNNKIFNSKNMNIDVFMEMFNYIESFFNIDNINTIHIDSLSTEDYDFLIYKIIKKQRVIV